MSMRWSCTVNWDHEQALALHQQLGNPLGEANQLGNLGLVARLARRLRGRPRPTMSRRWPCTGTRATPWARPPIWPT